MTTYPDNMKPLTYEEIMDNFEHVFNNNFMTRTMIGKPWNVWQELKRHDSYFSYNSNYYTKGYFTQAILINKNGEKDLVRFWKKFQRNPTTKSYDWQYGYSFMKRELCHDILN